MQAHPAGRVQNGQLLPTIGTYCQMGSPHLSSWVLRLRLFYCFFFLLNLWETTFYLCSFNVSPVDIGRKQVLCDFLTVSHVLPQGTVFC